MFKSNPLNNRPFFPVSNFHVMTEDMDSGGERLGGQMFGRRRRVLSVLLLIYILWSKLFDIINIWLLLKGKSDIKIY